MRRRNAVFACMALFAITGPAVAEEPTRTTSDQFGKLVHQKNWATFGVVLGRITVLELRLGQSHSARIEEPQSDCCESFSMRLSRGVPSIRYELQTPEQRVSIYFATPEQVEIVRQSRGTSSLPGLRYTQKPGQDIALKIGDRGDPISAPSLWHLLLAEKDACEQHLLPVLEILHPNWRLLEKVEQIEQQMIADAKRDVAANLQPRVKQLVHDLSCSDFQVRRRASHELRALGPTVLYYLDRTDPLRLDAEQLLRLHRVRDELSQRTGDTPQRVALWLRDDAVLWLTLLRHPQGEIREVAFERLLGLHGRPLDFNPTAEPQDREEQLARIQDRLGLTD